MKREGGRESSVLAWFLGGVAAIVDSHAHTHTEREEEYIVKGSDWPAGHRALDCRDERSQSNILLFFLSVYEQKQFCGCLGRFSAAANGIKAKCRFLLKYNFRREIQKQKKIALCFSFGIWAEETTKKNRKSGKNRSRIGSDDVTVRTRMSLTDRKVTPLVPHVVLLSWLPGVGVGDDGSVD